MIVKKIKIMTIGDILKDAREKAGLSQSDVSEKMGYQSAQFISNIERNVSLPTAKLLRKMTDLYGIHYETIAQMIVDKIVDKRLTSAKRIYKI